MQALRWRDIDLDSGILFVRSSYARKVKEFQPFTKARKQLAYKLPTELHQKIAKVKKGSPDDYVVQSSTGDGFMSYHAYANALKRYCKAAGVTELCTHGLRHSTSELYQSHGASRDDLGILFGHSSP